MESLRIVEKKRNAKWVRCRMNEIRRGDVFRMFNDEHDKRRGVRIGDTDYIASSDAKLGFNGNYPNTWGVKADEYKK
jgi:hypothetical protein